MTTLAISSSANLMRASFQEPTVARLRQAAERAQQTADKLQLQARDAWQQAARAEANARGLDSRATQALADAGQAQDKLVTFTSGIAEASPVPSAVDAEVTRASRLSASMPPPASMSTPSPASVNNLGQRVGTVLSVTA